MAQQKLQQQQQQEAAASRRTQKERPGNCSYLFNDVGFCTLPHVSHQTALYLVPLHNNNRK